MEQFATAREYGQLVQQVEDYRQRLTALEKAVRDIERAAFKILVALGGNAALIIIGIILYTTGLLRR
jgi:prefoldin subunit 5